MKLSDLLVTLDVIAPLRLAEKWDNVGLLLGDPASSVTRCLLAIDYTRDVADEARAGGHQLVLAYHPVIFDGLKRLHAGSLVYEAARAGLAIYSPHTALDVADGGTNDVLADLCGLTARTPVRVTAPLENRGLGRVGDRAPIARKDLLAHLREALGVRHLLVAGPTDGEVSRVAVGAGACGDLLRDVIAAGAGLYLTGEMRHHDALRAAAEGVTVVCALHSNSERVTLTRLAARLAALHPEVAFEVSTRDRDPFEIW